MGYRIKERNEFTRIINQEGYKVAAEIGLGQGINAEYLLNNTKLDKLYCCENWQVKSSKRFKERTLEKMAQFGDRFELVEGNSVGNAMLFEYKSLDYVYIDGNHRYGKCFWDLRAWWPAVREGGFFGGHDYVVAPKCGVIKAVTRFCNKYHVEFKLTKEDRPSYWLIKE